MEAQKKEAIAEAAATKKCSNNCDFISVNQDDRYCGKCGSKLV